MVLSIILDVEDFFSTKDLDACLLSTMTHCQRSGSEYACTYLCLSFSNVQNRNNFI